MARRSDLSHLNDDCYLPSAIQASPALHQAETTHFCLYLKTTKLPRYRMRSCTGFERTRHRQGRWGGSGRMSFRHCPVSFGGRKIISRVWNVHLTWMARSASCRTGLRRVRACVPPRRNKSLGYTCGSSLSMSGLEVVRVDRVPLRPLLPSLVDSEMTLLDRCGQRKQTHRGKFSCRSRRRAGRVVGP